MKAAIDEQLFTEQVLKLVAYIKKINHRVHISFGGSVTIACGSASPPVFIGDGITGKYPGDIQIVKPEDDNDVKIALEIAEKELFDYDREERIIAVQSPKLKKIITDALCPSLLKTSDDIFEIAKSSTPVLLTLSLSGAISLPIQPVFFAAAAILLARSSIAAICKDSNKSSSE